ncbi:MAG: hypothetical protein LC130_27455 [Bryobacterales bacterium]|nr:hypothetical protein [Bryobacterales bacterium]
MPRANGGKEHPSSPGSNVAARENQNPLNLRVEVSRPAQNGGPANGLAVATAVAPAPAAGAEQRSPEPPARATAATNGQRRDQHPAYSVPFDGWNHELDGVLREFCKRGRDGEREAILAIRKDHPEISAATIWARIVYLGLTKSKRPPYSRHEWTPEDLQLMQSSYSDGRNGATRTIDALRERHPDWPRSVISWKAKSLGLSRKRKKKYQRWSPDADRQLISCEGFQLESVEKRMKLTKGSIWSRLLALDRGADFFGGFKTRELMKLLHLDASAVRRLKRHGLLLCERGRITEDSVTSLCRDHPEEIPFETLSPDAQHRLVEDYEYGKEKQAPKGGRKKKPAAESAPENVEEIVTS